jgi:hypothetical protein
MGVVTSVTDGNGKPLGIRGGHRKYGARRHNRGNEKLLMNCHNIDSEIEDGVVVSSAVTRDSPVA